LSTVVSRYRILRIDAGAAVVYNEQRRCNAVETYVRGGVRMVLVRVRETDCGRWV
jgi:thiamine monophosphate synthase